MSPSLNTLASGAASTLLAQARHLLIDLDGTLLRQHELIDGAAQLLARFENRYAIVSNNSTHTAIGLSRRLQRLGLRVPPERIVLAGELAVRQLARQQPDARVMLVASVALQRLARTLDCELVQSAADVVLLALDMRFGYARLAQLANEIRRGAALIVTNPDATHPGPNGSVVPETGALLAAVVAASGAPPSQCVGKPEPFLFEEAMRRLGARPEHTLVVGDNALTDGTGAARLGLAFLQVGAAPARTTLRAALAEEAGAQYRLSESTSKVCRKVLTETS